MPDLDAIHEGARLPVLTTIAEQEKELNDQSQPTVTCPCGAEGPLKMFYRCFYCDIYFCPSCAEEHFEEK